MAVISLLGGGCKVAQSVSICVHGGYDICNNERVKITEFEPFVKSCESRMLVRYR